MGNIIKKTIEDLTGQIPGEIIRDIKQQLASVPGCELERFAFEKVHEKIASSVGEAIYEDTYYLFSLSYFGWSPSFSRIKIEKEFYAKNYMNDNVVDLEKLKNKLKDTIDHDLKRQSARKEVANLIGIKYPINTTGKNISEIRHLKVDRTCFDIFLAKYGSIENALMEICEAHHLCHETTQIKYDNYTSVDREVMLADGYEVFFNIEEKEGVPCISIDGESGIICLENQNHTIYMIKNFVDIPNIKIPETIISCLPGRPLINLIEMKHPVDNRIIENVRVMDKKITIELREDWLYLDNIISQIARP